MAQDIIRSMKPPLQRRDILRFTAGGLVMAGAAAGFSQPAQAVLTKRIPSSGEALPIIGLGTWITFNVGSDPVARNTCTEVMRNFFDLGGRMIDSSPMYGSSQPVIGEGLARLDATARVFSAEKVWTSSQGQRQIAESRQLWRVQRFDLLQVHNLLAWQEHLPMLFDMRRAGQVRYVGITTSEGRRHAEVERVMQSHALDFVQVSYNILDREVEQRILPLARERGIAVIANRPLREGALIRAVQRQPLPAWAAEFDCANWAQFLLKFIVSHAAITCAIPATSNVAHMRENMGAARGRLPDETMRRRMIEQLRNL